MKTLSENAIKNRLRNLANEQGKSVRVELRRAYEKTASHLLGSRFFICFFFLFAQAGFSSNQNINSFANQKAGFSNFQKSIKNTKSQNFQKNLFSQTTRDNSLSQPDRASANQTKKFPTDQDVKVLKNKIKEVQKNFEEAEAQYQKAIDQTGDSNLKKWNLARKKAFDRSEEAQAEWTQAHTKWSEAIKNTSDPNVKKANDKIKNQSDSWSKEKEEFNKILKNTKDRKIKRAIAEKNKIYKKWNQALDKYEKIYQEYQKALRNTTDPQVQQKFRELWKAESEWKKMYNQLRKLK